MDNIVLLLFVCIMAICCLACMFVSVFLCVRMYRSADHIDAHFCALRDMCVRMCDGVMDSMRIVCGHENK